MKEVWLTISMAILILAGCSKQPETPEEAIEVALTHLKNGDYKSYFGMSYKGSKKALKFESLDSEKQNEIKKFYKILATEYTLDIVEREQCEEKLHDYEAEKTCSFLIAFKHKTDKKKNIPVRNYDVVLKDGKWLLAWSW